MTEAEWNACADPQPTPGQRGHLTQRQPVDVDQHVRRGHPELHEVHQVGAAGQVAGLWVLGHHGHGICRGLGTGVAEGFHREASRTAATMAG